MKSVLIAMLVSSTLFGCDALDDMKGFLEKQELVQTYVKDKYGLTSQLGFNMHNGKLTNVTIVFVFAEVKDRKVSELERIAWDAAQSNFSSEAESIIVQIASTRTDS